MIGSDTEMYAVHIEYKKNHQNKQKEIRSYSFCRAFHGASFGEKIKVLSFI